MKPRLVAQCLLIGAISLESLNAVAAGWWRVPVHPIEIPNNRAIGDLTTKPWASNLNSIKRGSMPELSYAQKHVGPDRNIILGVPRNHMFAIDAASLQNSDDKDGSQIHGSASLAVNNSSSGNANSTPNFAPGSHSSDCNRLPAGRAADGNYYLYSPAECLRRTGRVLRLKEGQDRQPFFEFASK